MVTKDRPIREANQDSEAVYRKIAIKLVYEPSETVLSDYILGNSHE